MLREVFPTVDVSEADGCAAGADMHELSFDLIFLDPPFPYRFRAQLLERLSASGLLALGAIVMIHHPREEALPEKAGDLVLRQRREYGRSVVSFYRWRESPGPAGA